MVYWQPQRLAPGHTGGKPPADPAPATGGTILRALDDKRPIEY
jgi:hypothetical protein